MIRCQKCGHTNDNDATFCENCGANLKTNSRENFQKNNKKVKWNG